ncbi:MAG: hypothetical protein LC659_07565, partial [Myxococcales bacterium]|nr:hypothetical protein [Myxococcales bacterium]
LDPRTGTPTCRLWRSLIMWRTMGSAFALCVVAGCGHATPTGSAQNNWATPTGHASATNARVVDPNGGSRVARDRSVFARHDAPTLQPQPSDATPVDTASPPAIEPAPDSGAPDLAPPDTSTRDELPPYVTPQRP